jgi:hypothetical protein
MCVRVYLCVFACVCLCVFTPACVGGCVGVWVCGCVGVFHPGPNVLRLFCVFNCAVFCYLGFVLPLIPCRLLFFAFLLQTGRMALAATHFYRELLVRYRSMHNDGGIPDVFYFPGGTLDVAERTFVVDELRLGGAAGWSFQPSESIVVNPNIPPKNSGGNHGGGGRPPNEPDSGTPK